MLKHIRYCGTSPPYSCGPCEKGFYELRDYNRHKASFYHLLRCPPSPKKRRLAGPSSPPKQPSAHTGPTNITFTEDPYDPIADDELDEVNEVIERFWGFIRTDVDKWKRYIRYNLRLHSDMDVEAALWAIFYKQKNRPFKMNLEPGILLYNKIENKYR
jgi:hypothetical protein